MINWFIGIILNAKCVDDDCEWDWIKWSMQVWRNHMSNLNLSC
jgi:hypothetical protein